LASANFLYSIRMGSKKRRVGQVPGSVLVQSGRDLEGTINIAKFYMLSRVVRVCRKEEGRLFRLKKRLH
jgi:hypothetical protein